MNDGRLVCRACHPDLVVYGEPIPGYALAYQAGESPYPPGEPRHVPAGHFALFAGPHEPGFTWPGGPATWAAHSEDDRDEAVEAMAPHFRCGPVAGYALVKACLDAGYRWENSGMVLYWLAGRMAGLIAGAATG